MAGCDTMVHLVGVSHPSPAKAAQFRSIDLASALEAIPIAMAAGLRHFVYVSVAHPAPVMKEYIAARMEAEQCDPGLRVERDHPAAVVRPGSRAAVAAPAGADLPADGGDPFDPR